ncbi:HD-GYP domain-containing protein [Sporomusa aerivorans]|uniref:HD-GYP domain-containing protein n=1 Tax=Sporomusa aerivorans TaxID=204936 RepID=UPI00352B9471
MHNPQQAAPSILNKVNMEAIEEFCRQIYYCDPYTSMHAEHVAELMAGLASQMCMSADEINLAYIVGLIHDVGKIKIPNDILTKPDKLTDEEFGIMKLHSEYGAQILAGIDGAEAVVPIMRHHHERYDGRGYPEGLAGHTIPLLSRMLTVCDAFDAMTTNRCYRRPVTLEECIAEIRRFAGSQFDPEICNLFIEFLEERFGIVAVTADCRP